MDQSQLSDLELLAAQRAFEATKARYNGDMNQPDQANQQDDADSYRVFQAWYQYFRKLHIQGMQVNQWLQTRSESQSSGECSVTQRNSTHPTTISQPKSEPTPKTSGLYTINTHESIKPQQYSTQTSSQNTNSSTNSQSMSSTGTADLISPFTQSEVQEAKEKLLKWISNLSLEKEGGITDGEGSRENSNSTSSSRNEKPSVTRPNIPVIQTDCKQCGSNRSWMRSDSQVSSDLHLDEWTDANKVTLEESFGKLTDKVTIRDGSKSPSRFGRDTPDLLSQNIERFRLRIPNKERFLVRVKRITCQLSETRSRPQDADSVRRAHSQANGTPTASAEEPHMFVTFQAQLPSLTSAGRSHSGELAQHIHATGVRLGFSCSLNGNGPDLKNFETPKVASRLEAWERAGGMPGFRHHVLPPLCDTVVLVLKSIQKQGFSVVQLDTDYMFYPYQGELRQPTTRRRKLSTSSDSSVTRIAGTMRNSEDKRLEPSEATESQHAACSQSPSVLLKRNGWPQHDSEQETDQHKQRAQTWHPIQKRADNSPPPGNMTVGSLLDSVVKLCSNKSEVNRQLSRPGSSEVLGTFNGTGNQSFAVQSPYVEHQSKRIVPPPLAFNERNMYTNGVSISTPASPTAFLNSNLYSRGQSVPERDGYTRGVGSQQSKHVGASNRDDNTNEIVAREIINRLREHPNLPLVIMPVGTQTNSSNQFNAMEKNPLIFQLPRADYPFVCLPANAKQVPRVITAPKDETFLVIPSAESPNPGESMGQPILMTGPPPGSLMVLTADNKAYQIPTYLIQEPERNLDVNRRQAL